MQLKEEHIKILKNVLKNDIAIEKEQLKRLEELKLKEEILKVLEGNKEV